MRQLALEIFTAHIKLQHLRIPLRSSFTSNTRSLKKENYARWGILPPRKRPASFLLQMISPHFILVNSRKQGPYLFCAYSSCWIKGNQRVAWEKGPWREGHYKGCPCLFLLSFRVMSKSLFSAEKWWQKDFLHTKASIFYHSLFLSYSVCKRCSPKKTLRCYALTNSSPSRK